ncbi:amidohydrolase family protein [Roseibium sp. CAU 1637]|uniref:Amidohydrolase family protein n=1 Tax=Roseibium limicola TaxID=2816037 RepID=A0A939ES15_9HYPH|nr:amidohydrolase family protein [Roseibium limicola]
MKVVDAHMHVWDIERNYLPWLCDAAPLSEFRYGDYAALRRNYLVSDYRRDAASVAICGSVFVETGWDPTDPRGEISWIRSVAETDGLPSVIVGAAKLHQDGVDSLLEEYGRDPMIVGIRDKPAAAARPQDVLVGAPGSMSDSKWRQGYAQLARNGLSFDLQVPWWHLEEARDLADTFGETVVILNHTGLPADRSERGLSAWREALRQFALAPNARIKISGIGIPGEKWTVDANRWVVLEALDAFGTDRAMFASNFPVDGLVTDYDTIFQGFDEITRDFSEAERSALFYGNAQRIYRIPEQVLTA